MSLQAIWIVHTPKQGSQSNAEVIFSRFYQPFIKKSKLLSGDSYVPIPPNPDFAKAVCHELALMDQKGDDLYVCERDSCSRVQEKPVYEVSTGAGNLWPLIIVEQLQLLICCLPFVPQGCSPRPPLIDIPGVTVGFTLLCALMDYLRNTAPDEVEQRTSDLYAFLSHAAPHGSVIDTSVDSVLAKVSNKFTAASKSLKQPSWRSASHRGKNQMYLAITEYVRSTQYDRENVEDVWEVYGTVTCKADLEGHTPTVTMTISQATEGDVTPINHLLIHPCVHSADAYILDSGRDRAMPRRLRFTPPLEMFTLCHYTAAQPYKPPINGSFEMFVEEDRAKIKASLQLSETVKNNFEYCELQIPFGKRGSIILLESSMNHGSLIVSANKTTLVWNIGSRFPPRQGEVTMSAILQLGASQGIRTATLEEEFCTGQNAYAQLFFKIPDYTQSGSAIDAKSIQVAPNMKYKLTCVREYLAGEYRFWNVHGDSLVSAVPRCLSDRVLTSD